MLKIMFICLGNICRSPMAEFVMKALVRERGDENRFYIASSATSREEIGNDIHYGTKRILDRMGVPYTRRGAVQLTRADYEKYDLLIAMDTSNLRAIKHITGGDPENKVHLLLEYAGESGSIADPWYTGDFVTTYRDVVRGCEGLYRSVKNEMNS